ncbi:MFS transporter, partial [Chloroflexota bacterium]
DPMSAATERHGLFPAWYYPQYRLLWISSLGTHIGRWIEMIVGTWLILEMTNSPFLVGLLGACRFAAMLMGPFCGTIADRFNRQRILIAAQAVYATGSLAMMGLFFTSRLEVWHLFVFTIVGGLCFAFDAATRFAAATDTVESHHIANAVSLLYLSRNTTSILGPLLGGSLLVIIQASGCFALASASFILSLLLLLPMKLADAEKPKIQESIWRNLIDGLLYIKNDKTLLSLILLAALVNLFIFPYLFTLMPVFARDILHTGSSGYGQLMAAIGLGTAIGSLITASLPTSRGKLLIAVIMAWPALLIIFAASRIFPISLALLVFAGTAQGMSMALIQTLLLTWSPAEMRGRVSGARTFAIGTLPLGNLLAGAGANLWGAPTVLGINASASILLTIIITIWVPELGKRKSGQ